MNSLVRAASLVSLACLIAACSGGAIQPLDEESGGRGDGGGPSGEGSPSGGMPNDSGSGGGSPGTGAVTAAGGAPSTGGPGGGPGGCADPRPVVEGYDTGYFWCSNGFGSEQYMHRVEQRDCPYLPRDTALPPATGTPSPSDECEFDGDCAGPNGFCEYVSVGTSGWKRACSQGCTSDADCIAGSICACGVPTGQCVSTGSGSAACTIDADCGEGLLCAGASGFACSDTLRFGCQTPADECRNSSDCDAGGFCRAGADHWECRNFSWPYPCGPAL